MTSRQDNSISVRVFDGFSVESNARGRVSIKNRKACGLLAYLALSPHGSETRERLVGLLWSDRSEVQARASLRQCLKQLRGIFDEIGYTGFQSERQEVALDLTTVHVDLKRAAEQVQVGWIEPRLLDVGADPNRILYGFETLDSGYSAWLHVLRHQWSENFISGFQGLLRTNEHSGQIRKAAAEALLKVDPTHEEAHRFLISMAANEGNTPAALRQYKFLWDLLENEYDMEPAAETQDLIVQIKSGEFGSPSAPTAPEAARNYIRGKGAARPPVIGIWSFAQGGPWHQEDYLMEGFRNEIVAALIRFREWIVVDGRTLTDGELVRSPAPSNSARTIDYQLEGSYFEEGGKIGLIITLKEWTTQRYIWSERLAFGFESWFSAQQEIVRRLAVALNVYLSTERLSQAIARPELSAESYTNWLRGHHSLWHWVPENERHAETTFRNIIATTPDFAPAFSSLAHIFNTRHLTHPGFRRNRQAAAEALHLAQRSVELDPLDTRSQLALGFSYAMNERYDQAEHHFNLTYELNPNSPMTLIPCAHGLSYCGRHELAGQLADTAIDAHPMLPKFHWGFVLCIRFFNHDFERSIDAADAAEDVITDLYGWKAAALAHAGHKEEAAKTAASFVGIVQKRWEGRIAPSETEIVNWFLHGFPIKNEHDYTLLKEGLKLSGLPVDS